MLKQRGYLDELAKTQNMKFFYFVPTDESPETDNPTSDFLKIFPVPADNLPGILIFSQLNGKGVFFPLDRATIASNPERAEGQLADLFVMIDHAKRDTRGTDEVLDTLDRMRREWMIGEKIYPFFQLVRKTVSGLVNLPTVFTEALAKAMAEKLVT